MKTKCLIILLMLVSGANVFAQSPICATSEPFCTSNIYTFPAGVNSGVAEPGANYGCLSTRPNPAWYHMRIAVGGFLQIYMFSTPLRDIDFICWGPFNDPITPCVSQLTADKIVDCSYSPNPTEYVDIANAIAGKYYILLITNYSNQPCEITFQKSAGTGETDCTILPPPVSSNSPVCVTQQIELYADYVAGATYTWTGPAGFSSTLQNPVIPNAQLAHAGDYTLVIHVNNSNSNPATVNVVVNPMPVPNFTYSETCFGQVTQFTDQSTTLPAGQQITGRLWNFGDGFTSTLQNPQHQYSNAGTYIVTLTTTTGAQMCPQTKTLPVLVKPATIANAGPDITIPNGWVTQLNGSVSGGSGNYAVHWEPMALLVNPNVLVPTTVNMTTSTMFTLYATDQASNCITSDEVWVQVTGSVLSVNASALPSAVCQGNPTQLSAAASGGSGMYTFAWSSTPPGFFSSESHPNVTPMVTTTYHVIVFDGQNYVNDDVTVYVGMVPWADAGPEYVIPEGWTAHLHGLVTGQSTNYTILWQPQNLLVDPTVADPVTVPLSTTTTFTMTATDTPSGCSSSDNTIVYVSGGALGVLAQVNPSTICVGGSVQLDANPFGGSGTYTYHWTSVPEGFNAFIKNPVASPAVTTVYYVEVNDGMNSTTDDVQVIVHDKPTVNAGDNIVIPGGWTAQLHCAASGGSGNYLYAWTPANMLNNPAISDPVTIPLETTQNFSVTVTDNNYGCVNADDVMVIVSGGPLGIELSVSSNVICQGERVDLLASASGGSGLYQYTWASYPPGFSTDIPNPSDFPDQSITYYVTVSDGANQVDASVTVTVKPKPMANAGPDQTINVGTNTLLTGSANGGSGEYTYAWEPANLVENSSLAVTKTQLLNTPVVFTLTVTDDNGCVSIPDEVFVNATGDGLAVFAVAFPSVLCKGGETSITAYASGGGNNYTYTWTSIPPGFTASSHVVTVSPEVSTKYLVNVNDGFTQVNNEVDVTINPLPAINLIPEHATLYGQDTIIVCVRDTISVIAFNPSHPAGTQYFWSNFFAGDRIRVSTNGNWYDKQTYWVKVTMPESGCADTATITILYDFNQCGIGINETDQPLLGSLRIFPNPSSGDFAITSTETIHDLMIRIIDYQGRIIYAEELSELIAGASPKTISLSTRAKGLYTVLLQTKHHMQGIKMIIQ
ncbi:MAG: PKD domain-containing protein [Bacteroidales bacterium]|nr:PKD domain-containing protein [Bacteroidales bacterium]